ncbi:MAG TPA: S41 family peptidase, partial [Gemmatimonadaceae bacterium]|nr:S41 family peptidase [Gemmatimonadaceae bacterium]
TVRVDWDRATDWKDGEVIELQWFIVVCFWRLALGTKRRLHSTIRHSGAVRGAGIAGMLICCGACTDTLLGPAPAVDRSTMFDQLWGQFDLHYSFFAFKGVNWDSLGAEYRPRALAARTNAEFATQVGAMLRELKDVHVSLSPTAASTYGYVSTFDTITTYFNSLMIFKNYVPQSMTTAGGHIKYGVVAAGIGYVRIGSFAGSGWADEIDEALDSLADATSLIVDVRNNSGGNVQLAIKIAGRFTAISRRYGWVRFRNGPKHTDFTDFAEETVGKTGKAKYRGKVFVLTNRRDFSSAEDFVLAMRVIPRVTVVGDTTAGASGGPVPREMANGWSYEMSEWIEYLPGKKMFEGVGLAPDVYVRAVSGRDLILERALALAR